MIVTFMSFNVQHFENYRTRKIDFDLFEDVICQQNADVIALNEVYSGDNDSLYGDQVGTLARRLGFYSYFAKATELHGGIPYGNGLLSRYPIADAQTILVPDPEIKSGNEYYETRCLLKAKLAIGGGVDVLITHFGLNRDEKENALNTVLDNISDTACVLMGDFNVTPADDLLRPIAQRLYDTSALFERALLSFPSDTPEIRIDYTFVSRDIHVAFADIPAVVASDHRPYITLLEVNDV